MKVHRGLSWIAAANLIRKQLNNPVRPRYESNNNIVHTSLETVSSATQVGVHKPARQKNRAKRVPMRFQFGRSG